VRTCDSLGGAEGISTLAHWGVNMIVSTVCSHVTCCHFTWVFPQKLISNTFTCPIDLRHLGTAACQCKDLTSAIDVKMIFLLTGMGMTVVAEGVAGVAEGAGVDVVAGAKGAPPPLMMSTRS